MDDHVDDILVRQVLNLHHEIIDAPVHESEHILDDLVWCANEGICSRPAFAATALRFLFCLANGKPPKPREPEG